LRATEKCAVAAEWLQHNIIIRHVAHKTCNAICHMRAAEQVAPESGVRGLCADSGPETDIRFYARLCM